MNYDNVWLLISMLAGTNEIQCFSRTQQPTSIQKVSLERYLDSFIKQGVGFFKI